MQLTDCWHFKKDGITGIKIRIQRSNSIFFFPTRTSGREFSPYGSSQKHRPSFIKRFFYSSNSDFHPCHPALFLHLLLPLRLSAARRYKRMARGICYGFLPASPEGRHEPPWGDHPQENFSQAHPSAGMNTVYPPKGIFFPSLPVLESPPKLPVIMVDSAVTPSYY